MKQEKTLFAITLIILALMIAATVICAVCYMDEEPWWNRDAALEWRTHPPDSVEGGDSDATH